jgi:hypothetical protein
MRGTACLPEDILILKKDLVPWRQLVKSEVSGAKEAINFSRVPKEFV